MSSRRLLKLLVLVCGALLSGTGAAQELSARRGRQLYGELCASCHGPEGHGDGPTAVRLGFAPRNFSLGAFKCRSTPTGEAPLDEDLIRILETVMPGTPMVSFAGRLEPGDAAALVEHLRTLSPALLATTEPTPIEIPLAPPSTDSMVAEGHAIYGLLRCWSCHGVKGNGDGPAASGLKDDWGEDIRVYDFTRRGRYKCGGEDRDLYRLLHTGMTGSPMASFTTAFAFGTDQVGDPASLASMVGAAALAAIVQWLDEQPSAAAIAAMGDDERRDLVQQRTWSLIAYLRSLQAR